MHAMDDAYRMVNDIHLKHTAQQGTGMMSASSGNQLQQ
jgi:hypothetical protein